MKKHPSPLKAIRLHCLDCCLNQPQEVRLCGAGSCSSQPLRMGKRVEGIRPLSVIKEHCKECGGYEENPKNCQVTDCKLYPFRTGRNPNRIGLSGRGVKNFKQPQEVKKSPAQEPIQERTPVDACHCSSECKKADCACSDGWRK